MSNNPWRSLNKTIQNSLSGKLEDIAPWLFQKDKAFKSWYEKYYQKSPQSSIKNPAKRKAVYPEWYFNHALSSEERNSLLCVSSKLGKEGIWARIKKIAWVGNTGNILFYPENNAKAFHSYLLNNGYGDWWFASSGSKWDWGVRSRLRGCQLHFRGKSSSDKVEGHIDINNPGDPSKGEVTGAIGELAGALTHKLEDDYRRSSTHKPFLIRYALSKQGIRVPLVN